MSRRQTDQLGAYYSSPGDRPRVLTWGEGMCVKSLGISKVEPIGLNDQLDGKRVRETGIRCGDSRLLVCVIIKHKRGG